MTIGNFLKKFTVDDIILASILAVAAAILVALFWKPIKKFFVSILNVIKNYSATKKFEQKYRDWLINYYKSLYLGVIKTNPNIELENVFIPLRVKKPAERRRFSETEPKIKEEEDPDRIPELEEYEIEKTYVMKDIFKSPQKKFIVIGPLGSGKTTLLNYLALQFARKTGKEMFGIENEILPIFINLRDTTEEGFLDVKKFVENYNKHIEFPLSPPKDFFEKKLEKCKCIILLDGLDEVAKKEQRLDVALWLNKLSLTYSGNIFITTSRPYGYETVRDHLNFLELHILGFTPEQVKLFIRNWTKEVEIKIMEDGSEFTLDEADKKAEDLLKVIEENPKIEILTVNPLLLTILSLVHRYKHSLPKKRVELYEKCCDIILGSWDTTKRIAVELDSNQKMAILQPIAYHLHLNGLREEKREKVVELLEGELRQKRVYKEKINKLLDDIRDRCGILVEIKKNFFGFSLPTFQEFLTAKYILDKKLEDFLITKKRDEYWLEIILLYCGMNKDSTDLINKLLKEKDDESHTNLFLAGRCLAESSSVSPELRTDIIQKLFDIYFNKNEVSTSMETALEIIKEVKNLRIVQKLVDKTKDKESFMKGRAVFALGEIHTEKGVLSLIELLKNKDEESYVRGRAVDALGKLQAQEAILLLIDLLKNKDEKSYIRGRAAFALGRLQAQEAVAPLIELSKNKNEKNDLRKLAAFILGKLQAQEAVASLIEVLKNKDEKSDVRRFAAYALGIIQAQEAVSLLIELLKSKERGMRRTAVYVLGKLQTQEAISPLIEVFNNEDEESYVRGRAADALVKLQAQEAIPSLIEVLKNKDVKSFVIWRTADALGKLQAQEAVSPLIEVSKNKDEKNFVRRRAIYALGKIGDKDAMISLKLLLNDMDPSVAEAASKALKEISEKTGTIIYKD